MKATIRSGIIAMVLLVTALFHAPYPASAQQSPEKVYIRITVDGLSCPFCAYGLEKNLKKLEGAGDLFISVEHGFATFSVPKNDLPSEEQLKKIVKDAGFTAREITYSDNPFPKDED